MKKVPHPIAITVLLASLAALALILAAGAKAGWGWGSSAESISPPPPPVAEQPSLFSRFEFPLPSKPAPTPRSEKDEAIHQLSRLGLEPTEATIAKLLKEGQPPIPIDLFLKAGVKAGARDDSGRPLLVIASASGRAQEATELLLAGADLNATTPDGLNAVMAAAKGGHLELLKSLIENGASLDVADPAGHTALHHAILARQPEVARWLIESGAAATPCCQGEKTLSLHALESKGPKTPNALETLETALSLERPDEWHPEFATALLEAARTGDRSLTRLLIAHHEAAPPHPDSRHPLLGYAVAWGDHDMLRLLLECGADPNTQLGSPVEETFTELVSQKFMRYYLQKDSGLTPLMLAAGKGDLAAVEALLDHGAKKNTLTQKWRWPAISFAAQSSSVEVMQRLLGKSPAPEDQGTRIEISLSGQSAQFWKDNQLAFTTRISTGRSGYRTASGRFVITDKTRNRTSTIYKVNMPYFMRLNCSAIGMHAGYVPGYPASHGCIRVPSAMAARLFREVPVGTLVIIR